MMVSMKIKEEIKVKTSELLRIRKLSEKNTCKDDFKIYGLNKWVGNNAF